MNFIKGPFEMIYGDKTNIVLAEGTYKNFDFLIINNEGSHPCGYINIPNLMNGKKPEDFEGFINPHGGITYAEKKGVYKKEKKDFIWLGWDYAHSKDYIWSETSNNIKSSRKKWTTEEILNEIKNIIDVFIMKYSI